MKKLNELDLRVYDLIEKASEKGIWFGMKDLAEQNDLTPRELRKVITRIKESDEIERIIVSSSKGYKLLSSENDLQYLKSQKCKILKMLKRYWKDVNRYSKDNHVELAFTNEELRIVKATN